MESKLDLLPHLAAAIGRNPKCRIKLASVFANNRAVYHAAARKSSYYNHPAITSGRAEQTIMARRSLGILLNDDHDDAISILRDGWRPVWQVVASIPRGEPFDFAVIVPLLRCRQMTDTQTLDCIVCALVLANGSGHPVATNECSNEMMQLLLSYTQCVRPVRGQRISMLDTQKAKELFHAISIPGEMGLGLAFGEDRYEAVGILANNIGFALDDYIDDIALTPQDRTACVIAAKGDDELAKDLALWALTMRAIRQDKAFCLDVYRDDQEVRLESALWEARKAREARATEQARAERAEARAAALEKSVAAEVARNAELESYRQELAALRSALYATQDAAEEDEPVDAPARAIPANIVCIGGTERWAQRMREVCPGIKVLPADVTFSDADVRNASELWFLPQYLAHSDFYRAVNVARASRVPVYYFPSTGVAACARALTNIQIGRS